MDAVTIKTESLAQHPELIELCAFWNHREWGAKIA